MTSAFSRASLYTSHIVKTLVGQKIKTTVWKGDVTTFMSSCLALAGTKFSVPTSLHPLLHRQRLHDLLHEGFRCPLTLLSAPAGYGKTSVLSEWVLTSQMRMSTAWVSLDASDDDVHRFWLCVFLALQRCAPDLVAPLLALWRDQRTPDIQKVLSLLINRLLEEPNADYVLIIDDYHLISEPAIHQGLTYLIERLPPQLRLVLATRVDPPLSLSRLRARGHLLEVEAEHLQCTLSESAAFLNEVMGLSLAGNEVEEITERTEGWLVGLQLFALSLQGKALLSEVLTHASGNQRYILDYLTEEVLRQQPERLQKFLLVTSVLDGFCASLCDALWEEGQSQQMLETLERRHLFVVALDGEGVWYRYHNFFAEVLRHRLRQSLPQEEVNSLYGKASLWYAEQGQMHQQQAPHPSVFALERGAVAQVRVLLAEGRNQDAHRLLATWLPQARSTERWEHVLEMCLLQALAYQQMRREQDALHALKEALAIGEPEGYVRHFLDEGPRLVPLLKRSRERHQSPYVDRLLEAFGQGEKRTRRQRNSASPAHDQALIDPLSAREQEVLELLAQGISNQEIADALVIAPNTVKRHVQVILEKLEARNRTQAVVRAQQLDLLAHKLAEAS